MMEDRPRLFRHKDAWVIVLIGHIHLEFARVNISPNTGRIHVGLAPAFERWLSEHDPNNRIVVSGDSIVVTFSDENAAMLFRMTYDVNLFRFGG